MLDWLTPYVLTSIEALMLRVLACALPLALAFRGAALFGPLTIPWRHLAGMSGMLACLMILPSADGLYALWLCEEPEAHGVITLLDAGWRGVLLGLSIRCSLLVIESIASALEAHMQMSQGDGARPGGAISAMTLSLWAAQWWFAHGHELLAATQAGASTGEVLSAETVVTALLSALSIALGFAAMALFVLVVAELGLGLLQRAFPQLAAWQLTLPLRLVLALQVMRWVLQRPLGGTL